ncbi:hypothetical protein FRC01_010780 [Tulasnella sp. 417]|nr:hypothetical protein FRC01_010780 [Tulasnella sp. 417]
MNGAHAGDPGESIPKTVASVFNDLLEEVRSKKRGGQPVALARHRNTQVKERCRSDFKSFSNAIRSLNYKFDAFIRTVQPIGSSGLLIRTSRNLKRGMENILDGFRFNSARLWEEIPSVNPRSEVPGDLQGSRVTDINTLPRTMESLSDRLADFLEALRAIQEFSDEPLTDALLNLQEWSHYRAGRIGMHIDPLPRDKIKILLYIEQAMKEMSVHVSKLKAALSDFIEQGVKAIQNSEKKSQARLQNMSTVATFLSAVTATTMQYPMGETRVKTANAVLGLWISSLILSIASAINAQVAIHWRANMYRSPWNTLPLLASICLDHTPLVCLVLAVLAFSAGLVAWTVAADLAPAVRVCAESMTGATFLVLFTAILWEAREWTKERRKEAKQLDRVVVASPTGQVPSDTTNVARRQLIYPATEPSPTGGGFQLPTLEPPDWERLSASAQSVDEAHKEKHLPTQTRLDGSIVKDVLKSSRNDQPPDRPGDARARPDELQSLRPLLVDLDKPDWHDVDTAPTLADARHVCISEDGIFALISYGDENGAELWRVREQSGTVRLVFCTRFTPPNPPAREGDRRAVISGKARFCGESDAWAVATDGRSDIYIWHRATGQLLRTLRGAQYRDQFPDCGSINAVTSRMLRDFKASFIVVSASTEGGVIMWEDPEGEAQTQGESSNAAECSTKAS